jgi:hypothetical protein
MRLLIALASLASLKGATVTDAETGDPVGRVTSLTNNADTVLSIEVDTEAEPAEVEPAAGKSLDDMNKGELIELAKSRDLSTEGTKKDLRDRIREDQAAG